MINETGNTIPKHWQLKKLGEVFKVVTGTTPSKNNQDFYGTDYPFYKPTDLEQGINTVYARDGLTKSGLENGRFLPKDSILVTCIGATIGKTGLIKKEGSCNQQINAVLPNKDFHPSFIYYQIISERFQRLIKSNAASTTLPILNKSKFEKLQIVIPPLREQHTIVSKIEELFSELDNGKQQLQTALQQLKVYRQSLLKAAFEGKLTNKNVKDGELPEGWKLAKLGEACHKIQDGSHFSPQQQFAEPGKGRYMYITAKNIRNGYMDLSKLVYADSNFHNSIYTRCNPEYGDVLLTKDGVNTGEVTLNTLKEPFSLLSSVCLFKTRNEVLIPSFLMYYIQSPTGSKAIIGDMTGTAIKRIILRKIKDSTIVLPSIEEQLLIVQELESKLTVCDKIKETITQSLQQAETLRQSILKQAFEGKLV